MSGIPLATAVARTRIERVSDRSFANSVRVDQASGMVSIQAHCSFAEAVVLMRERAAEADCSIEEMAGMVLDRQIRFGN
jgi:AmiR/NasT family two-component response regulator